MNDQFRQAQEEFLTLCNQAGDENQPAEIDQQAADALLQQMSNADYATGVVMITIDDLRNW